LHWTKLRSTNPLERVNKEIGRRTDVVGMFPNDAAVIRLAGALLSEQNDEWVVQRRYLSDESMQLILAAGWTEGNSLEQQRQQEVAHPQRRLRPERPNDDHQLHDKTRLDYGRFAVVVDLVDPEWTRCPPRPPSQPPGLTRVPAGPAAAGLRVRPMP
jgi:Transposase, Mutator family